MMALLCRRESRHLEQQAWKETVELMKNHLELGSEHLTCLRFLSKGFVGAVKGEVKGAADVEVGVRKDKEATHSYKRANCCSFS